MLRKSLGKRIRFWRKLHGLTQAELAERIGVTAQYVGMLERGLASPSFEVVERIATALKRHPAELFLPTAQDAEHVDAPNLEHARPDREQGVQTLSKAGIDPMPGPSRDSVIFLDASLVVLAANRAAAAHLGLSLEEMIGKDVCSLLPPGVAAPLREKVQEALRTGRYVRFTDRLGQTEFEHDIYPIADEPGSPVLLVILTRDVTGQRLQEQVLRVSEDRLRAVTHGAMDALVLMDQDGNAAFWNPAAERLFGWKAKEVLGRDLHERMVPPELLDSARKGFQGFRENGSGPILGRWREMEALRKDGTRLPVEMACSGIMMDRGWHAVAVLRDISERKRMERAREDMERMTRHDLRGQIDGLLGLPEFLLMDQKLSPRQRQVLESIWDASLRMKRLIDFPLDLYRLESGVHNFSFQAMDLISCLRKILDGNGHKAGGRETASRMLLNGREPCPDDTFLVQGDETLVFSLLENLCRNAFEAAPEGSVVRIELETAPRQLRICNQGEVPGPVRGRLFFEKYATYGKRNGLGLGTYAAQLIAETHGWEIFLDTSRPGETAVAVLFGRGADSDQAQMDDQAGG